MANPCTCVTPRDLVLVMALPGSPKPHTRPHTGSVAAAVSGRLRAPRPERAGGHVELHAASSAHAPRVSHSHPSATTGHKARGSNKHACSPRVGGRCLTRARAIAEIAPDGEEESKIPQASAPPGLRSGLRRRCPEAMPQPLSAAALSGWRCHPAASHPFTCRRCCQSPSGSGRTAC